MRLYFDLQGSNKWSLNSACVLLPFFVTRVSVMSLSPTFLSRWPVLVCVFVHRAIFTYDGFTNKLKLADSGGKDRDIPLVFREYRNIRPVRIFVVKLSITHLFALFPPLFQQLVVWPSWQGSFTSPSLSMDCAKWATWRLEGSGLLWSAGWVADKLKGLSSWKPIILHIHMRAAGTHTSAHRLAFIRKGHLAVPS